MSLGPWGESRSKQVGDVAGETGRARSFVLAEALDWPYRPDGWARHRSIVGETCYDPSRVCVRSPTLKPVPKCSVSRFRHSSQKAHDLPDVKKRETEREIPRQRNGHRLPTRAFLSVIDGFYPVKRV